MGLRALVVPVTQGPGSAPGLISRTLRPPRRRLREDSWDKRGASAGTSKAQIAVARRGARHIGAWTITGWPHSGQTAPDRQTRGHGTQTIGWLLTTRVTSYNPPRLPAHRQTEPRQCSYVVRPVADPRLPIADRYLLPGTVARHRQAIPSGHPRLEPGAERQGELGPGSGSQRWAGHLAGAARTVDRGLVLAVRERTPVARSHERSDRKPQHLEPQLGPSSVEAVLREEGRMQAVRSRRLRAAVREMRAHRHPELGNVNNPPTVLPGWCKECRDPTRRGARDGGETRARSSDLEGGRHPPVAPGEELAAGQTPARRTA